MTIKHKDSSLTRWNNITKYPCVEKFESIPFTTNLILSFRMKDPQKSNMPHSFTT